MSNWREGDRVRIIARTVTEEDRKNNTYYEHMAGLVGTVQNVYAESEIAIRIDPESLGKIAREVVEHATARMREKFAGNASEEQKRLLSKEEMAFGVNYIQLVASKDLEKA